MNIHLPHTGYIGDFQLHTNTGICPHCGHCPYCGRGGSYVPPIFPDLMQVPFYDQPYVLPATIPYTLIVSNSGALGNSDLA